ncbi:hypothetical protein A2630_03985 [Candidatus Woesebacteria bacterium RIFCSPHIGHO2_01_FULL_44_10]|nr:MAG: hypothetical protein A2630_03985 [Candidatus Woesebacteria bacterium RIFCSPHIGHO2_01_FULL_44_10]
MVEVSPEDWVKGEDLAQVTLIEYSDFQCPACAAYYPLINQIKDDFGDNLKLVYRHFPLTSIHKNALVSAQAAEAAGLQGKLWEMHNALFEHQADWSELDDPTSKFIEYATNLELDIEKFANDLASDEVNQKVKDDLDSALDLKINATPTFFMNGKRITNPKNYDAFKSLIEKEINE